MTRLYERHAYVVWNVALRTALDDAAAASGARRAFAAQIQNPDEARLPLDAARLAVDAVSGVDARGVEDSVLAATAHLAAAQRAVLALDELTDLPHAEVAAKLGIEAEREQQLRNGAYEQLGLLLGITAAEARAAYEDVSWVEPPAELWQALYPELHGAVTQQAQSGAEPAPVAAVRTRQKPARARSSRRLRSIALAAVAALAVAGVAWAATGGDDSGGADSGTQGYTGLPASDEDGVPSEDADQDTSSLLTPEELDKLRREEIEQLKRFQRREDDEQLPQQERDRAARKVNDLVKLAQARQRAAEERELDLRRQLAREREQRVREQNEREQEDERDSEQPPEQQPSPKPDDDGKQQTGGQTDDDGDDRERDPVETECLYDPDSGTYICPE